VLEVNLLGPVHAARAALPYLRRSGGALIIVSSIEAVRALPNQTAYASSKYGVHGFIKSLRMEIRHARWPVSLTEVMPATINTPLFDQAGTRLGVKPIGVPPVYPPQQVARAILRAAVHPQEEIIVGGAGKLMAAGERLAPRLTEALLQRIAFQAERTDEPKPADAPHNLFEPLPGHDRVEGTVGGSTAVRAALRPLRAAETNWWLVAGGVLGAVALLAVRRRDGA